MGDITVPQTMMKAIASETERTLEFVKHALCYLGKVVDNLVRLYATQEPPLALAGPQQSNVRIKYVEPIVNPHQHMRCNIEHFMPCVGEDNPNHMSSWREVSKCA
jgi:hypothetical protein